MSRTSDEIDKWLVEVAPTPEPERVLYEQVGKAVVALSNMENLMLMMFVILSTPVFPDEAAATFYEQGSFEKRVKLLNFLVQKENRPKEVRAWNAIYSKLQTHKGVRNLVAHQGMFLHPPDETGMRQATLRPPWMKKSGKGRDLDAKTIKQTADALNKVRLELWSLIKTLHD